MREQRLEGLDALRGYAAIAVVLFHAHDMLAAEWLMPTGYLAVDVFFLMSGFVIARTYDDQIPTLGALGFLRVRLERFYPLYLFGLGLGLVRTCILALLGHSPVDALIALALALLFLPAPPSTLSEGSVTPLNGPAWSLLLEFYVNAAYALLFRWMTSKALAAVAAVSAAALIYISVSRTHGLDGGASWSRFDVGLARVGFSFSAGALLYRHRRRIPDLSRWSWLAPIILLCAFQTPRSSGHDIVFVLLGSPVIVAIATQGAPWRPLAIYGAAASYGIYALHYPMLQMVDAVSHHIHAPLALATLISILILLALTPFLDRLYDRPIRRWLGARRAPRQLADVTPTV